MSSEIIQGLYLSLLGITGVFIVLGCLAGFMWLMGIIQSKREGYELEEVPIRERKFSEKELLAITSAVQLYHTLYEEVVDVQTSEGWKKYSKIYQVEG
jgi:Na+-transporting methylmalonyl-CoA/oxaloacetate decarboxylase gamma subunit